MYFITTEKSWKLSESLKLREVFIRNKTCMLVLQHCSLASVCFCLPMETLKSVLKYFDCDELLSFLCTCFTTVDSSFFFHVRACQEVSHSALRHIL